MAIQITGQPQGILTASQKSGTPVAANTGWHNELLKSDLFPRYSYLALNGLIYSVATAGGGVALAATHLFSTAIATFTPILALYNPLTSGKNFLVLKGFCGLHSGAATQGTTGAFLWIVQSGQNITNAQTATPVSHMTLKSSGSQGTGITNVALAGAVGNAIVLRPIQSLIQSGVVTSQTTGLAVLPVDPIDGDIVIPPGGYAGMATGVSIATGNAVAGITYAELPT